MLHLHLLQSDSVTFSTQDNIIARRDAFSRTTRFQLVEIFWCKEVLCALIIGT